MYNNTSASKLVYDFISGFTRKNDDRTEALRALLTRSDQEIVRISLRLSGTD
jgi:hypothetical protein